MSIETDIRGEIGGLTGQRPPITLKSTEFRRTREPSWLDLEKLIGIVERSGVKMLSPPDLQRLPQLYRSALSSLSVARAIALDRQLLVYLESLSLRAYLAIYSPRVGLAEAGRQFLYAFPAAVIAARRHILISFLAFMVGAIAGFWLTVGDESWFTTFVPSGLAGGRGVASTRESLLTGEIFAPFPGFAVSLALAANFLFSNNTLVGIMAFSLGIFAGVPTVVLIAYNGVMIGAFIALHYDRGITVDFLGWIAIHGVTEISAILLFGAAGLVLAEKILVPDRYSRVDSLALHGRRAAEIAVGAVVMLFFAAILEGVFRQLIASTPWRFIIGAATGVGWLSYIYLLRPGARTT